jgi:2-polyprenyl-6-methoxyphenol hydroxylase-like FAD-dependent oxidoreductase
MTRALIVDGVVAGPVTAMALQRAGIQAAVYEAHAPTSQEVGSCLTVASNGIDALRAIDAHTRCRPPAGWSCPPTTPTTCHRCRSGSGARW